MKKGIRRCSKAFDVHDPHIATYPTPEGRSRSNRTCTGRRSDVCICGRLSHSCQGHSLLDVIEPIRRQAAQLRLVDNVSRQGHRKNHPGGGHPFDEYRPLTGPSHCTFGRELRPCTKYQPSVPRSCKGVSPLSEGFDALEDFTGIVRTSENFAYGYKYKPKDSTVDRREWGASGLSRLRSETNWLGLSRLRSAQQCGFRGYSARTQPAMTRIFNPHGASSWRNEG